MKSNVYNNKKYEASNDSYLMYKDDWLKSNEIL